MNCKCAFAAICQSPAVVPVSYTHLCRHAFTDALANGRPDSDDMAELAKLGSAVVGRIVRMTE